MSERHDDPSLDPGNRRLVAATLAALDESAGRLDAATLSALNRGRQRAVDAARTRNPRWTRALALATAASLAVALLLVRPPAPQAPPAADTLDVRDLELVAEADYELYEDWEFYAWVEAQSADG